jgi:hypothetical protein
MNVKPPSSRQVATADIVSWLLDHTHRFTAPYGVVTKLDTVPKGGKVRTVAFGVAGTLDAVLQVWSSTRICVWATGHDSRKFDSVPNGTFTSVKDFKERMTDLFL